MTPIGRAGTAALTYIQSHPGCSIIDVDNGARTARGGHRWMYATVHRLISRGLVRAEFDGRRYSLNAVHVLDAEIVERGNGLPTAGDHVPGDDGQLYMVMSVGRIRTGAAAGCGDCVDARVALAHWQDCADGDVFPALATIATV